MMDINNGWFETVNYLSSDSQQQTYVTKHDLELLHKKIIATDLIVQKYQDANRALLRLQGENDDLKQQVEQITNECCIFSKQVTECTQECDNLKEQISILNGEKREMQQQLRLLQDENTNNYHEIMVLKQYESLKEINDQLTKTIERQQKTLAKLQLQVQRKSPVVYKPNKNTQEPSETDVALVNSQKSVRELKLALGRLVTYIQISKIEIPTALNIRPVLKAHEINDDFLEIDGEIFRKPVKKVRKPVVSQTIVEEDDDDDDDDDDNNGDFIEVTPTVLTSTVNTTVPPKDIIEETPITFKASGRQQQKKKEVKKAKLIKKSSIKTRRQTEQSLSEDTTAKLDDLANELEIALSQPAKPESISQISSFFSDDDDHEDTTRQSDKQQLPVPVYNPIISHSSKIRPKTDSTITIIPKSSQPIRKSISFLSDDDNEEISQQKRPPISSFVEQQPIFIPIQTTSLLQVDKITPMEHQSPDKTTKYTSFLSEDDDDNKSLSSVSTPIMTAQSVAYQEYISPMEINDLIPKIDINTNDTLESPTIPVLSPGVSQQQLLSLPTTVTSTNRQKEDSVVIKDHPMISTTPVTTVNPNHTKIVLHLLDILTQVPPPLKRLRLVRHRNRQAKISEDKSNDQHMNVSVIATTEVQPTDQISIAVDRRFEIEALISPEPQPKAIEEENIKTVNEKQDEQISLLMENHLEPMQENYSTPIEVSEQMQVQVEFTKEVQTDSIVTSVDSSPVPTEEPLESVDNQQKIINETVEICIPISHEEQEQEQSIEKNIDERKLHKISRNSVRNQRKPIEVNTNILNKSSIVSTSQESTPIIESLQIKQPCPPRPPPPSAPVPVSKTPVQSSLKPSQIFIINRLLNVLTSLPVKPLTFPTSFSSRKRKRKAVINQTPVTLSRQTSNRITHSPTRMQTRSLNSIRACIARCNQPAPTTRKRTATTTPVSTPSPSPSPSKVSKRMKSMKVEQTTNEYDLIHKFINSFSKQIHDELSQIIEQKLHEDISLFNDHIYRIVSELMIKKCDIILPLVKQLHPYEESIQVLLIYINSKSSVFQQQFIIKLNQAFEYEMKQKQKQIAHHRMKVLNRLFFLSCKIFTLSSSITIYARLFDIGYYLPLDILVDALSFISNICSSLISIDCQTNSSNVLLHQILFDILKGNKINVSLDYLENLLIAYHRYTHDREDLLRCFVIISRYQTCLWCTNELCRKFLFPLLTRIDDQYQQRETILMILQYVLFLYKDNEDFQRDLIFHEQTKQLLSSLKTITDVECVVRDKIFSFFILVK